MEFNLKFERIRFSPDFSFYKLFITKDQDILLCLLWNVELVFPSGTDVMKFHTHIF